MAPQAGFEPATLRLTAKESLLEGVLPLSRRRHRSDERDGTHDNSRSRSSRRRSTSVCASAPLHVLLETGATPDRSAELDGQTRDDLHLIRDGVERVGEI